MTQEYTPRKRKRYVAITRFDGLTYIYLYWFNIVIEGKRVRLCRIYKRGGVFL